VIALVILARFFHLILNTLGISLIAFIPKKNCHGTGSFLLICEFVYLKVYSYSKKVYISKDNILGDLTNVCLYQIEPDVLEI